MVILVRGPYGQRVPLVVVEEPRVAFGIVQIQSLCMEDAVVRELVRRLG